jgi:regulator of sigma E protease
MITSILAAIVVLGLLIFVHELGHFLACKKVGVGVLRFSLGFGPVLFSKRVGETEYALSAIPLGGYVKMVGQEDDGSEPDPTTVNQPNSFAVKPLWARALIVVAGPLGNLLFAAFLFSILFATGIPVPTTKVGEVKADMPAAKAGIVTGDRITAVDGRQVSRWEDLSKTIREGGGKTVSLMVERDGASREIQVTPDRFEDKTIFGEPDVVYAIGVGPSGDYVTERSNPLRAVWQGIAKTVEISWLTILTIVKLFQAIVPASNLGGPLLIMKLAGEQAHEGLPALLGFMALLSINLGVLNLLPIPILDGGHLMFMGIEKILGRPLEIRQREIAQQVGMFLLISLMGFALYNDLYRLLAN